MTIALSGSIYKIFTNKKAKSVTVKMSIKLKKEKNVTCAIRLEMFEPISK